MSSVLSNVRFDRTQTRVSIRDEMPSDGPDVSIVMPCLNEAETLGACIDAALEALRQSGLSGEVVIADNGSTDGSQAIALGRGVRVVEVAAKGYGNALRGGIEAARGEHVVLGDADYSYDFLDVPRFVAKLREGYDLVMGNRFKGEILPGAMPWKHRYIGNPVLSGIGRLLFRAPVGDFHCGIRGLSRAAYSDLRLRTTGMEFASEMVIKSALVGLRIAEIPVQLRPDGRSRPPHLRSWRDGWRHLRFMLLLSPSILFLVPGGMLSVLGLLTFATVWSTVVPVNAVGLLRRRSRDARACRTTSQLLALWILGSLAVLFVTPFSVEDEPGTLNHLRWAYTPVRYGLCYLSFTTIAFFALTASFAQRLERRSGRSALVLCIALVSWQWAQRLALSSDIDLTVAVLIGSNVFLLACVLGVSTWRRSRRLCLAGTIALAALMGLGTALLSSRWHLGLASHFNDAFSTALFAHIERKWPDGATVHVYATRPYPFFGSLRQNRVIHPRSAPSTDESLSGSLACEIVVVERDDRNPVSRYRGIYELLSESTAYESIEPSAGGVYVAFRRNVAMAKDGD